MVYSLALGGRSSADQTVFLASARWVYLGAAVFSFIGAVVASLRGKSNDLSLRSNIITG